MGTVEITVGVLWFIGTTFIAVALVSLGPSADDFRRAKGCVVFGGISFALSGIVWGYFATVELPVRIVIVGLIGAISLVGITEGLRFVTHKEGAIPAESKLVATPGSGNAVMSGTNNGTVIGTQNNYYPVVPKKVKVLRVPAGSRFMVPKHFSGALVVDSEPKKPTTIVLPERPSVGQRLDISDGLGHASDNAAITVDGHGRKIGGFNPFVMPFSNQSITVTFDGQNWPVT